MKQYYKVLEIRKEMYIDEVGDLYVDLLTIGEKGSIKLPEGKTFTLIAGGIEREFKPGKYVCAILSIRMDFHSTVLNHLREFGFRTGLFVERGKLFMEHSVTPAIAKGQYDACSFVNGEIYSESEGFNAAVLNDAGEYTIKNLKIRANGNGRSDFSGRGSGILVTGKTQLTIDGYDFLSDGVVRNAITAADGVKVFVKNSSIVTYSGSDDERSALEESRLAGHMIGVPWVLGLWGNNRATNIIGTADVTYENCRIWAESWGVLSVDGIDDPDEYGQFKVNLTARNCNLEIFGKSGYGLYGIHSSKDIVDNCTIRVPDYALILSNGYSSAEVMNGTSIESKRFAFMWHQNQGGVLKVRDSKIQTKLTTFLIKGCYPDIQVENTILHAENGIILELIDLDDPGLGAEIAYVDTAIPEKDWTHDVYGPNYADVNIDGFMRKQYLTDARAVFRNMKIKGDFFNGTTNASRVGVIYPDDFQLPSGLPDEEPPKMPEGTSFLDMFPPSSVAPVNLLLEFDNTEVEGTISASRAKHHVGIITREQWYELGMVKHRPCEVVNNGVIVTLKNNAKWIVTGESYLSALHIEQGAEIVNVHGSMPRIYVNQEEMKLEAGVYRGNIVIIP